MNKTVEYEFHVNLKKVGQLQLFVKQYPIPTNTPEDKRIIRFHLKEQDYTITEFKHLLTELQNASNEIQEQLVDTKPSLTHNAEKRTPKKE